MTEQPEQLDATKKPLIQRMNEYFSTQGLQFEINAHEGYFTPKRIKFLIYGESGVGKTVFASTFPRPIFLDIDMGMASITKKVHRIQITDLHALEQAVKFLTEAEHPFQTIVLDSVNELQNLIMRQTIVEYPTIRRAYDDLPSQSDYGKMLDDFEQVIRNLRKFSGNVVYIAQSTAKVFDTDLIKPQLVGKHTATNLCRLMDIVGYLYKVEGSDPSTRERRLIFDATQYVTKDRSGILPVYVSNPTFPMLTSIWASRYPELQTQEQQTQEQQS